MFLDDVRLHDWAQRLPANATYYRGEIPRDRRWLPRFIDEFVMGQLETDQALDRLPDLTTRTAVRILIETGLRSVDCLRLPFDPVTSTQAGAPYLKYFNHKLSREAIIPISQRLTDQIRRQQHDLSERFGTAPPLLLPRVRANLNGTIPFSYATLSRRLEKWLEAGEVRDATGKPVRVTAHQFRHTVGTRMINNEVPIDTVQRMLDHASPEMTARYATIKDQTLRREWKRYQERINIAGEVVHLDPDGPLSDAAWALENLARAKQTLPNGYCGLPLQQTCPHPNACLTCPSFLTTDEFLPQHREQLARTEELIADAERDGRRRLVEINEPVRLNLLRIIDGLETLDRQVRSMPPEPVTPLAAAAARKHAAALERAARALQAMASAGDALTFQAVAARRRCLAPMALRAARAEGGDRAVAWSLLVCCRAGCAVGAARQRGVAAPAQPRAAGRERAATRRERAAQARARRRLRPRTARGRWVM